jgi:hypothetical protein
MHDEENLKVASEWIMNGKITINGVDLKTSLTPEHRYEIIKLYCSSKFFTLGQKNALKVKAFENDISDKSH